jgi:hypothetical protein
MVAAPIEQRHHNGPDEDHQSSFAPDCSTNFFFAVPFFAYHIPYISDAERKLWLERYRTHIARIEQLPQLKMPTLDDYDDTLRPHAT